MPYAERLPSCTTIVLAGPPGRAGRGVAAGTLDDAASALAALLEATALDGRPLEVFCELPADLRDPPGAPGAPGGAAAVARSSSRLRRHPPTADLIEAMRVLRASGDLDPDSDVAWVCAGTRVPALWNARLQASLRRDDAAGCISPLCACSALYSPFDATGHGAGARAAATPGALDAWLQANAGPDPVQMPAPLPWCGVLRAELASELVALRETVGPDSRGEAAEVRRGGDWANALARGRRPPAACLAISVEAPPLTAPPDAAPPLSLLAQEGLAGTHPLSLLRRALADAMSAGAAAPTGRDEGPAASAWPQPPAAARPARLHVAHSWGGGLSAWVRDFCAADDGHEGLVLRSVGRVGAYGQRLALYHASAPETPLRAWELGLPIHATAIAHRQYSEILDEIIDDFGVDSVIVSSLIGHSLDALRSRLPTIGVAHDHYPFCVAVFAHNGGECRSCDAARLRDCIEHNPGHRFFQGVGAGDWLALREAFVAAVLEHRVSLVAPSPSTADRWRALMPGLAAARMEVIPHGVSLPPAVEFEPPPDGPLRLLKIGRITMEKGSELIEALLPELPGFAELTLIGCGDEAAARLAGRPGVTAIPAFDPASLPALIAQARPHLGLQLSVVPETFSFTLSELWHCAVPVLGCRTGSLVDRIREDEDGFLCEPRVDALLARLRELDARRPELAAMRKRLRHRQQRNCHAMVADYRTLLPAPGRHAPPHLAPARGTGPREATRRAPAAGGRVRVGALSVDPEARYADVARAFLAYTLDKAAASPRLPAALRRLAARAGGRGPHGRA